MKPSVRSVEQPARLIRPRRVDLWRILRRVAAVVVILLLLIDLRVVEAAAAARRGIARYVRAAVGRIDVTVVCPLLRRVLARRCLLRSDHHGIAGGVVLLIVGLRRIAAGGGGIGAAARMARQRNLG